MSMCSRIQLGMSILGLAKELTDVRRIACTLGVSEEDAEKYLAFFVGTGSIYYDGRSGACTLTRKGLELVAEYDRLNELVIWDKVRAEEYGKLHYGTRLVTLI